MTLRCKTCDISLGGLCVMAPEQLPINSICAVMVETLAKGKTVRVVARTKVIYCILAGTEGFRVGLQLIEIDAPNRQILTDLMASPAQ